ncbi:hypothetical protein ACH5RR_008389 [Cinchona calisaya]|uniref:Centromere protein S n=1 Tax=Cinchona calisaya TaxID=153742 RepID=A0ABD3AF16_9GENT
MERGVEGNGIEVDRDEEEAANEMLRDRFRLCTISIAEAEGIYIYIDFVCPSGSSFLLNRGSWQFQFCSFAVSILVMEGNVMTLGVGELDAEQLAKDLELFAQHAGRKSVNMEDVILSAHRNSQLAASLRSVCNDLKEPPLERKRRRNAKKDADPLYVPDQ